MQCRFGLALTCKEKDMKPAAYVTTFSLIATTTVLSPGMAAETDVNAGGLWL